MGSQHERAITPARGLELRREEKSASAPPYNQSQTSIELGQPKQEQEGTLHLAILIQTLAINILYFSVYYSKSGNTIVADG